MRWLASSLDLPESPPTRPEFLESANHLLESMLIECVLSGGDVGGILLQGLVLPDNFGGAGPLGCAITEGINHLHRWGKGTCLKPQNPHLLVGVFDKNLNSKKGLCYTKLKHGDIFCLHLGQVERSSGAYQWFGRNPLRGAVEVLGLSMYPFDWTACTSNI